MESYCVKEKRITKCVEPSGYMAAKNGRRMFFCHCASCGIKKTKFVKDPNNPAKPKVAAKPRTSKPRSRKPKTKLIKPGN